MWPAVNNILISSGIISGFSAQTVTPGIFCRTSGTVSTGFTLTVTVRVLATALSNSSYSRFNSQPSFSSGFAYFYIFKIKISDNSNCSKTITANYPDFPAGHFQLYITFCTSLNLDIGAGCSTQNTTLSRIQFHIMDK